MDEMQHLRLTSSSCAKVFVQRDYSEGIGVKFETKIPIELQDKIDSSEFEEIIGRINMLYEEAERLSLRTVVENCIACLTSYVVLLCFPTYYEKVLFFLLLFVCFVC
jgi:hypothetical protein